MHAEILKIICPSWVLEERILATQQAFEEIIKLIIISVALIS